MLRNSIWLMAASGLMAGFGFIFWLFCARFFGQTEVGVATTLVAATTVISFLSLMGLNSTLIRYLPTADEAMRSTWVATSLAVVAVTSVLLSVGYAYTAPHVAYALAPALDGPLRILLFVAVNLASALNLATDAVFIAVQKSRYNFWLDGAVQGLVKLIVVGVIVTFSHSSVALFGSFGAAALAGAAASCYLIQRALHINLLTRPSLAQSRTLARFSLASYVGSLFNLVPLLLMPILVLRERGAAPGAVFYLCFQFANLTYAIAFAIGENFLAEASQHDSNEAQVSRRAAKLTVVMLLPVVIIGILLSSELLALLGPSYASGATTLRVLLLGAIPVGLSNWTGMLLKIRGKLVAFVIANVLYAFSIIVLCFAFGRRGLVYFALAWFVGNVASGVWGIASLRPLATRALRRPDAAMG